MDRAGFLRSTATGTRRWFGEAADHAAILAWTVRETAGWQTRRQPWAAAAEHLRRLNETSRWITLFAIGDGAVTILPKPADPGISLYTRRAALYRDFFQAVIDRGRMDLSTVIAMSMEDIPVHSDLVPTFALQKPAGSSVLLMPDVDFLTHDLYRSPEHEDHASYDEKSVTAAFVGSTTGGDVTMDVVRSLALPRLRAAMYFKGSADVLFDLPNIVQCDGPETEAAVRALGVSSHRRTWHEQFGHRFLISMDGNGATCSRVVIALKSASVLLKYDSPHQLYYFSELVPWRHYIPIASDRDVEAVIAMERRNPGEFRYVAEQGRAFYQRHLVPEAVFDYAASLLRRYVTLFD